jgi:hypothetical protein
MKSFLSKTAISKANPSIDEQLPRIRSIHPPFLRIARVGVGVVATELAREKKKQRVIERVVKVFLGLNGRPTTIQS